MDLSLITPLVITFNEAPNICDTLYRLQWAKQIVMVDSFSTDETVAIAKRFPNVSVYSNPFEDFASQCNFGLSKVASEWCLSMDADYKCSEAFANELKALNANLDGYQAKFVYCIHGNSLRGSLYPARTVLYRTRLAQYTSDGHAHRVMIQGSVGTLRCKLLHDDRKDIQHWVKSQYKYASKEMDKLSKCKDSSLSWVDWLRAHSWLTPFIVFFYCLMWKRLLFDGIAGMAYTYQRVYAEVLLCLLLSDRQAQQASDLNKSNT